MINIEEKQGVFVAKFNGQDRFNALIAEPVKEELLPYFNSPDTQMIIDLSGIKFIDSSGFSALLSIMKAANNNFGGLKICCISSEVMELFEILQLHNVFEICNTIDDCMESFH